ncbi:STAS/SEC14 domain-containing protein [Spongiibacter sp. KMU-166]|uniref:STAS/SEC14 domain-containing protein n=1 Tax=Spongiibacter thalassae TaxID=2721624 RepID=A0ABX1GG86_9GAMM|nr:STAS/SEC14 domain-containing protein [Spongiibacter thalassae]NKI18214.1 STAS/SEC14 domain-containing protein [Spongiibacter thalassae]
MITVTPTDQGRVDVEIEGTITKEDMQVFLEQLSTVAEGMEHGHMLFKVTDFHWPSLGAVGFELSHFGQFLRAYKHFERAAVVCHKSWIRKVGEWEGHLFSWISIRAFTPEEEALAIHWLEHGDREQAA